MHMRGVLRVIYFGRHADWKYNALQIVVASVWKGYTTPTYITVLEYSNFFASIY